MTEERFIDYRLAAMLSKALDGFDPTHPGIRQAEQRIAISRVELPVPALARYVLSTIGCPTLPREDKTAWVMGFTFRGVSCRIADFKLGMRLYVAGNLTAPDAKTLCDEMLGRLNSAIRLVEKHELRAMAEDQLMAGNFGVRNQYPLLDRMYWHFRDRAKIGFDRPRLKATNLTDSVAVWNEELPIRWGAAFDALAMVNAYFSVFEHLLVLAIAFTDFDPGDGRLIAFIKSSWRDKFKWAFDLQDADTKRRYDRLVEIAETYRNTFNHGGFDKEGGTFGVQLPGVGAVPGRFSAITDLPTFHDLFPVEATSFAETCEVFDATDDWLRSGRLRRGARWAESALDVNYDKKSRKRYRQPTDDVLFELLIRDTSDFQDALDNYDL